MKGGKGIGETYGQMVMYEQPPDVHVSVPSTTTHHIINKLAATTTTHTDHQHHHDDHMNGYIVIKPNEFDVRLGRGKGTTLYKGNRRLDALIKENCNKYANASSLVGTKGKKQISAYIVRTIQRDGGRFLKLLSKKKAMKTHRCNDDDDTTNNNNDGCWVVVPDEVARIKVSQALKYRHRRQVVTKSKTTTGDGPVTKVMNKNSNKMETCHQALNQHIDTNIYTNHTNDVSGNVSITSFDSQNDMLAPIVVVNKSHNDSCDVKLLRHSTSSPTSSAIFASHQQQCPFEPPTQFHPPKPTKEVAIVSPHQYHHTLTCFDPNAVAAMPLDIRSHLHDLYGNRDHHLITPIGNSMEQHNGLVVSQTNSSSTTSHVIHSSNNNERNKQPFQEHIDYNNGVNLHSNMIFDVGSIHDDTDDISISTIGDDTLVTSSIPLPSPSNVHIGLMQDQPTVSSSQMTNLPYLPFGELSKQQGNYLPSISAYPRPGQDLHSFLNQVLAIGYFPPDELDEVNNAVVEQNHCTQVLLTETTNSCTVDQNSGTKTLLAEDVSQEFSCHPSNQSKSIQDENKNDTEPMMIGSPLSTSSSTMVYEI